MKDFIFGASLVWFWYTPKTWTAIAIFAEILAVLLISPTVTVRLQYRWQPMEKDEKDENDC